MSALSAARRYAGPGSGLRLGGAWGLAFLAGIGVGRALAPDSEPPPVVVGEITAPSEPASERRSQPAPQSAQSEALLPSPGTVAPESEPARSLSESAENPGEIFGAVIDALRDDEILAVLATATDMNPEELRGVRDPRALAQRMSEIAVGDLLRKPGEHPPNLGRVYFSEQRGRQEADGEAATFTGKEPIIARFANDDYRDGRVFMKWTRTEGPEIVLFRPFPVKFTSHYSEIELRSESELPPGRYKVAFYSDDERMQPVASGHYFIASEESD